MKAHCWQIDAYGKPGDVLNWREQELSDPGPGKAIVKVRAIGLNRSDLQHVRGHYFPTEQFPSCVGAEAVGEIVALGAPIEANPNLIQGKELAVGMRVGLLSPRVNRIAMGVCRDIGIYDQGALAPVPESFSDAEGAAFWTALLTMGGAMEMGGVNADTAPGTNILIAAGASGMGVIGLKLAKCWGATTIATTRSTEKVDTLNKISDHVVVCHDSDSLAQGVRKVTNGDCANLLLDPVGALFYPGLLEAAAPGGNIVSYECMTGDECKVSVLEMMLKDLSFHGYTIFRPNSRPALLNYLIQVGMNNAEALRPLISNTFALSELTEALETLGRSKHIGKIIVEL